MRLTAAVAAVALLPLLGGCIIYSNEGGEKVSVITDQSAART